MFARIIPLAVLPILVTQPLLAAPFQNLGFEQGTIAPAPSNYTPADAAQPISASSALPGWRAFEDATQLTALWGTPAGFNPIVIPLDQASIALITPSNGTPIAGNFSLQLSATLNRVSSIDQTGDIPAGTQSLQLLVRKSALSGSASPIPTLSLNGTVFPLFDVSTVGDVHTFGANIAAYAGTTADLRISCIPTLLAPENMFDLDAISLSPTPIPEPTSVALLTPAALLVLRRRKKGNSDLSFTLSTAEPVPLLSPPPPPPSPPPHPPR